GIADFNNGRDDDGVILKIGLHQGACIAVTSDERLDYFGSMVNRAARLQGENRGGNVVLSTEMIESAGPNDQIEGARNFELVQDTGRLRGFDNPITYWRMTKRAGKA
ncbi:MAG: adenylate/guanylate cyclase domain-containing protein, partial [Pseudomonadota bacterium]|nr:adenylate/guanylate cyclase domain-containing protein [Pseudomonadota bacterium]